MKTIKSIPLLSLLMSFYVGADGKLTHPAD